VTWPNVTTRDTTVLLGDSTPSELPANILGILTEVVLCARDVATAFAEIEQLERRRAESTRVTEAIVKELGGFARQTEVGVRATAGTSVRPELRVHGEEVVAAVTRMIQGWQQQYERTREATHAQVGARITALRRAMHEALERFLVPRRVDAPLQRFHRFHDGQRYLDTATVEPLSGVRVTLSLADGELEVPRRIRSLLGKGHKIQVGTRITRLRRAEEPVFLGLDDQLLIDAERGPGRLRLLLAKKPGTSELLRVEIKRGDAGLGGEVARADGETFVSPIDDRPVLEALWKALDGERDRILACPAQLVEISLDGRRVEDAAAVLTVAERLVDCHRATVGVLARHSPNSAELSIKIVTGDGKREEAWVRRDELAQHLLGLPGELRSRFGIAELYAGHDEHLAELKTAAYGVVGQAGEIGEEDSMPIDLEVLGQGTPGAPIADLTHDISLVDVMMEDLSSEDSGCVGATKVRLR
jgi:hypothetical protein